MLMTLEELAGASGVSAAELYRIETGESAPTADYLAGMAAALGIRAVLPDNSLPPDLNIPGRQCEVSRLQPQHIAGNIKLITQQGGD